jgi:hypothetical protein
MSSSGALHHALLTFREQLERRQQQRREERLAKTRATQNLPPPGTAPIALSMDVKALFDAVMASVARDRDRYTQAGGFVTAAPVAAKPEGEVEDAPPPYAQVPITPTSHMQTMWDAWKQADPLLPSEPTEGLPPAMAACATILRHELAALMQDNSHKAIVAPALLAKIRQAVQAFMEQRPNDAVTLLKNVLHSDPHNHIILAILSQILYAMAASGAQTTLHDARDHGQRCTIFTDKITPEKLAYFRYMTIVSELAFGPEKALEWLRETGMLKAAELAGPQGLFSQRGIYLRAWAILAHIPTHLWDEHEFEALRDLVLKVIGGAAVYAAWFRNPLLQAMSLNKSPNAAMEEIEHVVYGARANHEETAGALHQLPLQTSDKAWLLRVRYLHSVVRVAPIPAFDQALCHIAVDGHAWTEGQTPDNELRAVLDYRDISYWRLWALVMTPYKDVRQPYLLPAEETMRDGDMLASCDQMLASLQEAEQARIRKHLWEDLKPWMVRWQLEHLLAAGTGSNKPRTRFAPSLPPYTSFYRLWQEPVVSAMLASELIAENAMRGGFASMFEVLAAMEGAYRLLDDPVHGLQATQKRALEAAHQYNPKKFPSVSSEFGGVSGGSVMLLLLPVGLIGLFAGVLSFSANWSQAFGLLLALAGVGGVIAVNLKK